MGAYLVELLRGDGFTVTWDGQPNRKLEVTDLRWEHAYDGAPWGAAGSIARLRLRA